MTSLIWILGLFVHLVYLLAIFDIYYSSPLIHNLPAVPIEGTPPASRLVLFVADGLRAESFFQNPQLTPFLRRTALERGSWGVSHTRVPTESRPGHVAIIGGFYEDVASVTRGWKENPVEFDSVFNRSKITYSWGSPDILPMFSKGAAAKNVLISTYDASNEDFGAEDPSKLDTWVFNSIKDFFHLAVANETIGKSIRGDGVVFFLHLLGLDTNGHGNKPHSAAYLNNIGLVDRGVEEVERLLEDFYGSDGRTAFVFTSDHGMTDWGSHGAGLAHETETPLVAWGAGVKSNNGQWGLNGSGRMDVEQADIAPLMSSLLAIPIPVNSVGRLPVEYLNVTDRYLLAAIRANYNQVKVQFLKKREEKLTASFQFLFQEFPQLDLVSLALIEETVAKVLTETNGEAKAVKVYRDAIPLVLDGMMYFHRYERLILGGCVAFGFLSWMAYVISLVVTSTTGDRHSHRMKKPHNVTLVVSCLEIVAMAAHGWHWPSYIYVLLPNALLDLTYQTVRHRKLTSKFGFPWKLLIPGVTTLFLTEFIVGTFFQRTYLSIAVLGGSLWCLASSTERAVAIKWSWIGLSLLSCSFLWLPSMGSVQYADWVLACATMATVAVAIASVIFARKVADYCSKLDWLVRTLAMGVATLVLLCNKSATSSPNGYIPLLSWTLLLLSLLGPLASHRSSMEKLTSLMVYSYLPYLLMSLSFEAIFYVIFCCLLLCWIRLESSTTAGQSPNELTSNNFRRSYMLVVLVMLAFFGTGNLSSLNSFNPNSVRCFLTVFNPFVMGALLLLKIFIPFMLVCCSLEEMLRITNTSAEHLFMMALVIFDFMAVHFFFLLKDTGSWLDIGTSISHYVIMLVTTLVLICLYHLAKVLSRLSIRRQTSLKDRLD